MKIDLSPILGGETGEIPFDYPLTVEEQFPGCTFPKPVRVLGTITNKAGYIAMSCEMAVSYDTACDRCLLPITKSFSLHYERPIALSGTLENEDQDEYLIAENKTVDLDGPITEALILDFPMKNLCKEDCKGLCQICGKNLNEGNCGCEKKEVDPRLAGLAKLLSKNK